MNVINGGAHADNRLDIQEFMLVPAGLPSFSEALRAGSEIFHALKRLLKEQKHVTGVGDEGGFAPDLPGAEAALGVLVRAIEAAGYRPGEDVWLALDVAATELWRDGRYHAPGEGATWTTDELIAFYERLADQFPLVSIEDGLREDDWDGWTALTERLGDRLQLVGDDLFVTSAGAPRGGHPARRRQRDPDQGEPDRHADRDARRRRAGQGRPATGSSSPTARGRPRTPSSRISPSPSTRGRSRRDRSPAAIGSPSTTSSSGSRSGSETPPAGRARRSFRGAPDEPAHRQPPAAGLTTMTRLTRPGWIVVGALLILAVMAVFGDNGVLALRRLRGEVDTLVREVRTLEAENERLSRAISELQEDPAVIERIAREELGLVRPGERVLRFPRSARPGEPAPALPSPPPRSP